MAANPLGVAMAVAGGGALGALARFWLYNRVHDWLGKGFPYGTLVVNVSGSLAMGFLYVWLFDRMSFGELWRAFLLVGCLGAFTTFSTFSLETFNLLESGAWPRALLNAVASVTVCVSAAALGATVARSIG